MDDWSREDVSTLSGVGPKIKEKLARLGIENKQQLLFHLPLRYEDRTRITALGSLQVGQHALIQAEVLQAGVNFARQRSGRRMLMVKLGDGTGFLTLRFFHFNSNQQSRIRKGSMMRCFGEVRWVMGGIEMIHPEYEMINPDNPPPLNTSLSPIYPTTEGLHQIGLRKIMSRLLDQLNEKGLAETLPTAWLRQFSFPTVTDALQLLHNPNNKQDVAMIREIKHPAQQRFIIEELTAHRLSLMQRRKHIDTLRAPEIRESASMTDMLRDSLEFSLTQAQSRVIEELFEDYRLNKPMMRLIQGDVGCGKTIVAAFAALAVINSGYQCALMAPTEILAEQNYKNFCSWLEPLGIEVVKLFGAHKGKIREQKEASILSGQAQMIIGTHALFQASVKFFSLGLIIIDEQHRFGVDQRQALQKKANHDMMPHQLIMTATPIPRTLAMSIYADLDYSQINELPPGRTPVKTSIIAQSKRDELIDSVRKACTQGQQVYWVCTLIEESEVLQCEAAEQTFQTLRQQLDEIPVGLVHGRMKAADKETVIRSFKENTLKVLVATTVIEVGVDVPNASIMIIENPERLGLSQIHQLRGRVGRGNKQSFCLLLVNNDLSRQVSQRLEVIRNNQDGFVIAEKDLELRGAGDVLGTRQTGEASFRLVDLVRDKHRFAEAEQLADLLIQPAYQVQCDQLLSNWVGSKSQYSDVG